jgi:hypothetical protein
VDVRRLRYLVRPRPHLTIQVVIAAGTGRPTRPLVTFAASALPDGGMALAEAVDELTAGGLAGVRPELAAGILTVDAAAADAGLVAVVDPEVEAATLLFALPNQPLEEAVVICGVGDAPPTAH